jgi:hypothetical protein
MASTFTIRLGLEKPDPDDDYTVNPHNNNMDIIDALAGAAVICTSVTRPTPPDTYPGLLIFETDTGLLVLRNPADSGWLLFTQVISCTSLTRPTATHPGMLIYETDSQCMLMRNNANTAWTSILGGATAFNTNNVLSTTTSTTYGLGSGNMPGLIYVVPPSGQIKLEYSACLFPSAATANQTVYFAPIVRQGATIGGGTILSNAIDDDACACGGSLGEQAVGRARIVPGLTPGNTVNIQGAIRNSHNTFTGNVKYKKIIVSAC